MARKRRKRPVRASRPRKRLRPKPFIVLFLTINIPVGIWNSQVTRVRNVQVEGAMPHDRDRIKGILVGLRDKPFMQIDKTAIAWELSHAPEVRSVRFETSPIGRAWVSMQYRTPVVRFYGDEDIVMDFRGVIFRLPKEEVPEGLPTLKLERVYPPTLLTVAGDWPSAAIGELATKISSFPNVESVRIDVDDRGAVCLNIPEGRIVLGSTEDLDKKLEAYRRWREANPDGFSKISELNLMQPDRPSERQKL